MNKLPQEIINQIGNNLDIDDKVNYGIATSGQFITFIHKSSPCEEAEEFLAGFKICSNICKCCIQYLDYGFCYLYGIESRLRISAFCQLGIFPKYKELVQFWNKMGGYKGVEMTFYHGDSDNTFAHLSRKHNRDLDNDPLVLTHQYAECGRLPSIYVSMQQASSQQTCKCGGEHPISQDFHAPDNLEEVRVGSTLPLDIVLKVAEYCSYPERINMSLAFNFKLERMLTQPYPCSDATIPFLNLKICSKVCHYCINHLGYGFCYLRGLHESSRLSFLLKHGIFPKFSKIVEEWENSQKANHTYMKFISNDLETIHFDSWGMIIKVSNSFSTTCSHSYADSIIPISEIGKVKFCDCGNHVLKYNLKPINGVDDIPVGGQPTYFMFRDLVHSQNDTVNPTLYTQTEDYDIPSTVSETEHDFVFQIGPFPSSEGKKSRDLKKTRHDLVAACLNEKTDIKLEEFPELSDVEEGGLTPDYVNPQTRVLAELRTTANDELYALVNSYNDKMVKYEYISDSINCSYYVLVVSPNCVYSNMSLTQSTVNELCSRMKVGITLEAKITDMLGYDIFREDLSQSSKRIEKMLKSLDPGPSFEDYDHNDLHTDMTMSESDYFKVSKIIAQSYKKTKAPESVGRLALDKYLSKFTFDNSTSKKKRCCNIPLLYRLPSTEKPELDPETALLMPNFLKQLWTDAKQVSKEKTTLEESLSLALSDKPPEVKHKIKSKALYTSVLTSDDSIHAAERGLWAKGKDDKILKHVQESKKSFHPDTDTEDIKEFVGQDILFSKPHGMNKSLWKMIMEGKRKSTLNKTQESPLIFAQACSTPAIQFANQISMWFSEIAYSYRHWTKGTQLLHKVMDDGTHMIIKTTSSHIFVSYAIPRTDTFILETGRIGPSIFLSDNYYFCDFCSYNEPTLEHFVKAGPYLAAILVHISTHFQVSIENKSTMFRDINLRQTFNHILLLYLNNKTDVEELITCQRYIFMKMFEEIMPDVYLFSEKLPEVLRSRVTVYFLRKTMYIMDHYSTSKILKMPRLSKDGNILYEYLNIKSLFCQADISLEQKVNEFYFGYVISKERGRGADRTFKILKKILAEEYKYLEDPQPFKNLINPEIHKCDPTVLKYLMIQFEAILKLKYGNDYKQVMKREILKHLSGVAFSDLATLKASSRNHDLPVDIMEEYDVATIKSKNSAEFRKRPKVLQALIDLVSDYSKEHNLPLHVSDLVPYCIETLEKKNGFDSDIFAKPQHGGDREIHVLEIMARIVQFHIESISQIYCRQFTSETITHPETKLHFVKTHYKETASRFKTFFVMSKSADATKWCQRHHGAKFSKMLLGITDPIFSSLIMHVLSFWPRKRLSFPMEMVKTLCANKNVKSTPIFEKFRDAFYSGGKPFVKPLTNKINIRSGMMQGILHYTSSLFHTMIQESLKVMVHELASQKFHINLYITIVQGSDDSGMMIGCEGSLSPKLSQFVFRMLKLKDYIADYVSVNWNACKTSIGTIDLIEYNSEWHVRHKAIKPTFRWVSASLEVSIVEKFIDRIRQMNNSLKDCLEGGASTLECAVIQLCQSWLHYMLLGIHTHILGSLAGDEMLRTCNPSLGFFPCDFDVLAGIPGVDFQLYMLYKYTDYSVSKYNIESEDPDFRLSDETLPQKDVSKDLKTTMLGFGNIKLWHQLREKLHLNYEELLQETEKNPFLVFCKSQTWSDEKIKIGLKVFQPGVKESLSNYSSVIRLMTASAYILNTPCMTEFIFSDQSPTPTINKKSLYKLLLNRQTDLQKKPPNEIFPLHAEYEQMENIVHLMSSSNAISQELVKTSKVKLTVYDVESSIKPLEMAKKQWNLGGVVPLSSRQFPKFWDDLKMKYTFLEDKLSTTKEKLSMTNIEVRNLLESLEKRSRVITLQGTSAKGQDLRTIISRVYWPNTKLLTENNKEYNTDSHYLRSVLFSILSFWETNLIKTTRVRKLLTESSILKRQIKDLPKSLQRLKIFRDKMTGIPQHKLLQDIINLKTGTLGVFVVRQSGQGKDRKGLGIWRGIVCGISTEITLWNTTCTSIKLGEIRDAHSLALSLTLLLREFNSLNSNDKVQSNLWLTKRSRIQPRWSEDGSIPIIIDPDLIVQIVQDVEMNPWSIQLYDTTIRLTMKIENQTVTILNETLHSRDWDPSYSHDFMSVPLNCWHMNMPIPIQAIEQELFSVLPTQRGNFLREMARIHKPPTLGGWDLDRFCKTIISFFPSSESLIKYEESRALPDVSISKQLIDDLYDQISKKPIEEISTAFDWSEEVEEQETTALDMNLPPETIECLMQLGSTLKDIGKSAEELEALAFRQTGMLRSNKAFSLLEKMSELQLGVTLEEAISKVKASSLLHIDGVLGILLSYITKEFIYGRESTTMIEETASLHMLASEQSQQILSEKDIKNIEEVELEASITRINDLLPIVPHALKTELLSSRQKFESMLNLKRMENRMTDIEGLDYDKVVSKVLDALSDLEYAYQNKTSSKSLQWMLCKLDMLENESERLQTSEITPHEHTIIRNFLQKNVVSTYLLESISRKYKIKFIIKNDQMSYESCEEGILEIELD